MKTLFGIFVTAFLFFSINPSASFAAMPAHGEMCVKCEKGKECPMCKKKNGMKCSRNQASTAEYMAGMERMHKDMHVTYTGDTDTDFARGMVPHHQGAVDMAEVVLKHGKDEEVRKLAEWILASQKQEIAWMKRWIERKGSTGEKGKDYSSEAYAKAFDEANATMHKDMDIIYSGDADYDFVRGMIPHHQGAVDMAQILLKHGQNLEMKKLASGIILGQNREIKQMKQWLEKYPAPPLEAPKKMKGKKKPADHSHHH